MEGSGQVTADIDQTESAAEGTDRDQGARTVALHLTLAITFLLVAAISAVVAAIDLVFPDVFDGIRLLSFGVLTPMVAAAFLYGWLTVGFLGGVYYVLPRISSQPLRATGTAYASGALVSVGVVAGIVGIALGHSEGRPLLEMPLYADALVFLGLVFAARTATKNIAPFRNATVPAQWYLLAATWWAPLVVLVGNIPGISGFSGAMQTSFYAASLTGFWFAAAGIGLIYYLIPRLLGAPQMAPSSLSALGFWSLAVVWAATGPVAYVYGPGPGWYETLGIAFAIALFVPVLVIVADFVVSLRGQWANLAGRGSLPFIVGGAFLFLLIPVHTLVLALRTSSAVVSLTEWVPAGDMLAYGGAFTMWLFALYYDVRLRGTPLGTGAAWHLRLSMLGVIIAVAAMWMAGAATGFTWAAGANSTEYTSFGEGWVQTQDALAPYLSARLVGAAVFALAQVWGIAVLARRRGDLDAPAPVDADPIDLGISGTTASPSWGKLRWGAVALFVGAFLATVLLPSFDPSVDEGTILGDRYRVYPEGSAVAAGRQIYLQQGCYYCHTQEVRPIVTDAGLGPVSEGGDYVHETPAMLGVERLGPDLMHVGERYDFAGVLVSRLIDPRGSRSWSIMPSYDYLSDDELNELAEYLLSLR